MSRLKRIKENRRVCADRTVVDTVPELRDFDFDATDFGRRKVRTINGLIENFLAWRTGNKVVVTGNKSCAARRIREMRGFRAEPETIFRKAF
jgi:hypothetical protein